ncbi:MAG: neutral/alkaline non-lysosomal ceramidase N-terminal domain-containing protein [Pseudomonadota bacterium]
MTRSLTLCAALLFLVFAPACGGGGGADGGGDPDTGGGADLAAPDLIPDTGSAEDTVAPEDTPPPLDVVIDERLRVGAAVLSMNTPIGISTAGYGQSGKPEHKKSPLVGLFIATDHEHTDIACKAIWVEKGDHRLAMASFDVIGVTQDIVKITEDRLEEALGLDMRGKVLLNGTHTHLGPGRLSPNYMWEVAADLYWQHFYNLFTDRIVECLLEARADLEYGAIGHGLTECETCHSDRRCENPEFMDHRMWVLRLDREDGTPKAAVVNFAIHGTVFGWSDAVLSGDAPGAISQKIEENLPVPIPVLFVNSWGGDAGPGNPTVEPPPVTCDAIPGNHTRMEAIGYTAWEAFSGIWDGIETSEDAIIDSVTYAVPLDTEAIGYAPGEFDYPNGGGLCGNQNDVPCWGEAGNDPNMLACLPLLPGTLFTHTALSAARFGDLLIVTLPGEPLADLSVELAADVAAATGIEDVAIWGYSQDHLGYILHEYDFMAGGYEPSMVFWGPKEGDYLAGLSLEIAQKLVDPAFELSFVPKELTLYEKQPLQLYLPMANANGAPAALQQPPAEVTAGEMIHFQWLGGDPWPRNPVVHIETQVDGQWQDLTLPTNGRVVDSSWYRIVIHMDMDPPWKAVGGISIPRDWIWTADFATARNVPTPGGTLDGTCRFVVDGTWSDGGGVLKEYQLTSEPFTVSTP